MSYADKYRSLDPDQQAYLAVAEHWLEGDDDTEVDGDLDVDVTEDGAWVRTRTWVPKDSLPGKDP